jgi:hypothetical protein
VLDWATARGYREGPSPARWRGHLDKLLARPSKVADVEHHAPLPFAEIGEFMRRLRGAKGMGARALEYLNGDTKTAQNEREQSRSFRQLRQFHYLMKLGFGTHRS